MKSVVAVRLARQRLTLALLATLLLILRIAAAAPPGRPSAREDAVRAAFLFHLAQFVNWPETATGATPGPLRICVYADEAMAASLHPTVRGKTIAGRSIEVIEVDRLDRLEGCHLAFLGGMRPKDLEAFLRRWTYPPVLLVGEADRFAELGGMVNLVLASGKVTFEINLDSTQRAQLGLRSQLLRFATLVSDRRKGPPQ